MYIKAEGLLHSLSTYLENPTQVKDILNQYKLDRKEIAPVHLEIIAQVQQKTVLCLHLNHTNIAKIVQCQYIIFNLLLIPNNSFIYNKRNKLYLILFSRFSFVT